MSDHKKGQLGLDKRGFLKAGGALGVSVGASGLLPSLASAAQSDEYDMFRVAMWSGTPNLDPEQNTIRTCLICQNWLFDPLVWRDGKTNQLEPWLAHEYKYIGKNTWRFSLREGVKFHNGKPLDANAVKFSMDRRLSEKTGSPWFKSFKDIVETKVIDQYTIEFVCNNPFPMLPAYLPVFSITEPEHYAKHSKEHLALNPLGSGPFRLNEFKPDDILRVDRNDEYWGEKSIIKKIEAPVILESASRVASLLAGDLHIAPRPTIQDFERIEANESTRVASSIGNRIVYLGLNYDMEPFKNRKVRQALNYAIDQAEINDVYLNGTGEVMGSALPSTVPGFDAKIKPYPFDPDRAKALLKEAGYGSGFKTKIEAVPEWMISGTEIVEAVINYLRQVGIEADFQVFDAGTMSGRITRRKAGPIYTLSWGGNSTFDADSYLETLMGKGAWSCNYMPEVDKLVAAGRQTTDQSERIEIYQQACAIIHEEAPWIFLHLQPNTYGANSGHDWAARADEMIPVQSVRRIA